MPDFRSLELAINPSIEPLHYPGSLVTDSCVIAGSWLYPLHAENDTKVGTWEVTVDGGPLQRHHAADVRLPLDELLGQAGVSPTSKRHPVLAVGSNASPGQLRHKFSPVPEVSDIVPLTGVAVRRLRVSHSAHVSATGYIPYAPLGTGQDIESRLFMLWLDEAQLALVNKTELNYHPVSVSSTDFPAMLESGEAVETYTLYRGRWGLLRLTPTRPPVRAMTQAEVFRFLASLPWFRDLVPECLAGADNAAAALRVDAGRRAQIRDALARDDLVADDHLNVPDSPGL